MPTTHSVSFGGETLVLGADRTLWWPRQRTLFIADLHAGKAEHMRRYGVPIPGGSLEADLARLQAAATHYDAATLVFLGDLFHSESNDEWDIFAAWCHRQPYTKLLVRGNHDRFLSDEQIIEAGIEVRAEPCICEPFVLGHHPVRLPNEQRAMLAGHVHPVVRLQGPGRDRLRVPCFWLHDNTLIIPAFSSFAGGFTINKQADSHIYACSPDASTIITVC